jgi:2-oxoglutarate ferredoxin oxidoreductase subunit gamma
MRAEIRFAGFGGQGIISAGKITGRASAIYDGNNAVMMQSYGPEARGGATRSDVIISDEEIHFPKVIQPNVLVCLTQTAYNKYSPIIRPGGILITDSHFVKTHIGVDARRRELPMFEAVMDKIGQAVVFNICMLGAVIGLTDLLNPDSVMAVIKDRTC